MFGNKEKWVVFCSMTCRFCFHKGKFFVLMNASQKGGKWIAMGPDRCFYSVRLTLRKVSIPFTILLLLASLLVRFVFQRLPSAEFGWFLVISYAVTIVSYLYTSLCDPGIIRPSEDNSEENKNSLEPLGYTYCTICGVYRPPGAYHCSDCGVCFLKYEWVVWMMCRYDHHCTFMG